MSVKGPPWGRYGPQGDGDDRCSEWSHTVEMNSSFTSPNVFFLVSYFSF